MSDEGRHWPPDDAHAAARVLVEVPADEAALRAMAAAALAAFLRQGPG
jgi:hypothetical protein